MPRIKQRFENVPIISVIGLIALTFALVSLIPSLIGISKNAHTINRLKVTQAQLRETVIDLRAAQVQLRAVAKLGVEAHAAACSYLAGLRRAIEDTKGQLEQSTKFLLAHPQGIDGITPDLIRAGIARLQGQLAEQTGAALTLSSRLNCTRAETSST